MFSQFSVDFCCGTHSHLSGLDAMDVYILWPIGFHQNTTILKWADNCFRTDCGPGCLDPLKAENLVRSFHIPTSSERFFPLIPSTHCRACDTRSWKVYSRRDHLATTVLWGLQELGPYRTRFVPPDGPRYFLSYGICMWSITIILLRLLHCAGVCMPTCTHPKLIDDVESLKAPRQSQCIAWSSPHLTTRFDWDWLPYLAHELAHGLDVHLWRQHKASVLCHQPFQLKCQ